MRGGGRVNFFVLDSYIKHGEEEHKMWRGRRRVQPTHGGGRQEWPLLSISEGMDDRLDEDGPLLSMRKGKGGIQGTGKAVGHKDVRMMHANLSSLKKCIVEI